VAPSLAVQDARISRNVKADLKQLQISLSTASATSFVLVVMAASLVPISFVMIGLD